MIKGIFQDTFELIKYGKVEGYFLFLIIVMIITASVFIIVKFKLYIKLFKIIKWLSIKLFFGFKAFIKFLADSVTKKGDKKDDKKVNARRDNSYYIYNSYDDYE